MEVSALGETGVVGLVALLALIASLLLLSWRWRSPAGRSFLLLLIAHVVDTQVGIFWVAVTGSFTWIILGIAAIEEGSASRSDASDHSLAATASK